MARPKKETAAEPVQDNSISDVVEALNQAGRTDLAVKLLAQRLDRPAVVVSPQEVMNERLEAQRSLQSELERQHGETHYWITFNKMGDQDTVPTVYIGAAGVSYHIRKGERVLLPESAINALKLAVRVGLDHGRPIQRGDRKYLRVIRETEYGYTIDGQASPEEAAQWRAEMRASDPNNQEYVPIGRDDNSLVEVADSM